MAMDAGKKIKNCGSCHRFKTKPNKKELHPFLAMYSLELVHIDFLTIESGKSDKEINDLVVTDHFTHYAQALLPLPNCKCSGQDIMGKVLHALLSLRKDPQ